jgi:hypothetical protein
MAMTNSRGYCTLIGANGLEDQENVTAGTKCYYVVTAIGSNAVTQSSDSQEVSATVPSP